MSLSYVDTLAENEFSSEMCGLDDVCAPAVDEILEFAGRLRVVVVGGEDAEVVEELLRQQARRHRVQIRLVTRDVDVQLRNLTQLSK